MNEFVLKDYLKGLQVTPAVMEAAKLKICSPNLEAIYRQKCPMFKRPVVCSVQAFSCSDKNPLFVEISLLY